MKKGLIVASLIGLLLGCAKSNDNNVNTEKNADVAIDFTVTTHQEEQTCLFPLLFFRYKRWGCTGVEICDPHRNNDYIAFQVVRDIYVNGRNYGAEVLVVAGKDWVSFVDFNSDFEEVSNNVLNVSITGDQIRFTQLSFDWETGAYEVLETSQDNLPSSTSNTVKRTNVKRSIEDDFAQSFYDLFEKIGDYSSAGGHFLSGAPQFVTDILSKVVVPFNKHFIYSYNPQRQEEIRQEELESQGLSYLTTISSEDIHQAWENWGLLRKVKKIVFKEDEDKPSISDEERQQGWNAFQQYKSYTDNIYQGAQFTCDMPYSYKVSANLLSVGKTTATIKADYTVLSPSTAFVSSMGFVYGDKNGFDGKTTIEVDNFPYTLTLKDLHPGRTYTVKAYMKCQGITYTADVEFTTDDEVFSVIPQELVYNLNGSIKLVYVELGTGANRCSNWSISSSPDWCIIETGYSSFSVKVEASSEERSGIIQIIGERANGSKEAIDIKVSQIDPPKNSIVFNGDANYKLDYKEWAGGTLYQDESTEEKRRMTIEMTYSENGDIHIDCDVFKDWVVSSTDPPLIVIRDNSYSLGSLSKAYGFSFSYDSYEFTQDNSHISIRGSCSFARDIWRTYEDWVDSGHTEDGKYEYTIDINELNTTKPKVIFSDYTFYTYYEWWKYNSGPGKHSCQESIKEWRSFNADGEVHYTIN